MRVAVIFLVCITALVSAQFNDAGSGGSPQRGLPVPIRTTRYQRLPPPKPTQSAFANQKFRRPISFRPRGGTAADDGLAAGPGVFPSGRPGRPNLTTGSAFAHQVKPVNEEPEDEPSRESTRERDDDNREPSQEQEETEEVSEENVARAVANLGAIGATGGSRQSSGIGASAQAQPAPAQYRAYQEPSAPSGRGAQNGPPPVQYRPAQKPTKPRKQIVEESFKQQAKLPPKPIKPSQGYDPRGKKPVAQIIRRYRNDNADGSITWGFENDDGSYKEELIGVDCITRGKYGYIDPDGLRREYTYETGIKCDEEQREEEEENGFVDYQENKLVLPDGKTIDLSTMGKKQTRRPRPGYGH